MKLCALSFSLVCLCGSASAEVQPFGCARSPDFVTRLGIKSPVFSTSDRFRSGLLLFDGASTQSYQHPSWKRAGRLGPIATDELGNLYVAPVPHVNTLENPFSEQNTIYRVDSKSEEMAPFVRLPVKESPSMENPFGLLGLTYDCSRRLLYAATVSGSRPDVERGALFAIRVDSGELVSQREGIDALGLAVSGGSEARLLYGSARRGEVRSLSLDTEGRFIGEPRGEFVFDPFHSLVARKLRFEEGNLLLVEATEFGYNLIAATEIRGRTYRFEYLPGMNVWREMAEEARTVRGRK